MIPMKISAIGVETPARYLAEVMSHSGKESPRRIMTMAPRNPIRGGEKTRFSVVSEKTGTTGPWVASAPSTASR